MISMKIKRIDPAEPLIAWLDQHQEVLRQDFSKGELAYVCPNEDCPSRKKSGHVAFSVNIKNGLFGCFHCQLGGRGLVMLLKKIGVNGASPSLTDERKQQIKSLTVAFKEEKLNFELQEKIASLPGWKDFPPAAQEYWRSRGLSSDTAEALAIRWQEDPEILNLPKSIIFPAYNADGDIYYCTGATLAGKKCHPAGISKQPIRSPEKSDVIILTEGAFDMASVFQIGFSAWAVLGGTSRIKGKNAKFLKGRKIILLLDGDAAGQQAAIKLKNDLDGIALEVKIVNPPDEKDPNDILREEGEGFLQNLIPGQANSKLGSNLAANPNQMGGKSLSRISEEEFAYLKSEVGEISSFLIQPKFRVWNGGKEDLIVDFITSKRKYQDELISRNSWNSREQFLGALPSVDLQFHGTREDVQSILGILASYEIPLKQATTKLGFHLRENVWMMPNYTISSQGVSSLESGLEYMPIGRRGELDDKINYLPLDDSEFTVFLTGLVSNIFRLQSAEVIIPILGWFIASTLKPKILQRHGGFPILFVAGTRGAGKSSLVKLFWRLFGFADTDGARLLSVTATNFMLLKLFSATWSIPIVFDEFKIHDLEPGARKSFTRYLRRCYNSEVEHRGRADLSSTEFSLTSPVAVVGEDCPNEAALQERMIPVEIPAGQLDADKRAAFELVRELPLAAFCNRFVPFIMDVDFDTEMQLAEDLVKNVLSNSPVESDRIFKNLSTIVFGFNQFVKFTEQVTENDIDLKIIQPVVSTLKDRLCGPAGQGSKVALDQMIHHLSILAERDQLVANQDYVYQPSTETIAIRLDSCLSAFRRHARETQLPIEILEIDSYKRQLKESKSRNGYVVDESRPVRFGEVSKRAVVLDVVGLENTGIDPKGFQVYRIGQESPTEDENEKVDG